MASEANTSTIEEPVSETIMRDVRVVGRRLGLVILPGITSERIKAELRDWELWGPLFICMTLAVILSVESKDKASLVFSILFIVIWLGSAIVTINAQLLGAQMSFFQTLCLLGYCVFPLLVSAFLCLIFNNFVPSTLAAVLRVVAVGVSFLWSLWAASSFLADARMPEGRTLLALYPAVLFYLSIAWMVLVGLRPASSAGVPATPPAGTTPAVNETVASMVVSLVS